MKKVSFLLLCLTISLLSVEAEVLKRKPLTEEEAASFSSEDKGSDIIEQIPSYNIISQDILEITVYGEPDLSKTVQVSDEGVIKYPLIGEIKVAGLTADEVAKKIEDLLRKDYLANPQVSLVIREHGKVFIFGAVNQPGSYELKGPFSLVDILVLAGGPKENANLAKTKVIRADAREYTIDLESQGKNFFLKPLDKIIIEEYGKIYVVGAVKNPGIFKLATPDLTPLDAIMFLGGGVVENANLSAVKLSRTEDGKKKEYVLDLENEAEIKKFFLKEEDRILVELYKDISIFGQVRSPGKYKFKRGLTAVEAISMAGGFTDVASTNGVRIIREEKGKKRVIKVLAGYILRTGDKTRDIELKEGDSLVVPETWF